MLIHIPVRVQLKSESCSEDPKMAHPPASCPNNEIFLNINAEIITTEKLDDKENNHLLTLLHMP